MVSFYSSRLKFYLGTANIYTHLCNQKTIKVALPTQKKIVFYYK